MIKNIKEEVEAIVADMRRYLKESGAKGLVIGNCGGKDSAAAIGLATLAIGPENVIAVKLPCGSLKDDMDDADLVAETFKVKSYEVNIDETFERIVKATEIGTDMTQTEESLINVKPRLRMTTLYMIAQTNNYLVCGTGNKCETKVGYFTKFGDGAYDYNPLGDFYVDEVYQILEYIGGPKKLLTKAPADGLSGKSDEEKMGVTYDQITEFDKTGTTTPESAYAIIERMVKQSEHKRRMPYVYKRKYE